MSAPLNPLFLALLIAGVAVVIGVIVYNWLQERRVRRKIEAAFRKPVDGLSEGAGRDRLEPQLRTDADQGGPGRFGPAAAGAQSAAAATAPAEEFDVPRRPDEVLEAPPTPLAVSASDRNSVAPDPDIECVVLLQTTQAASTAALSAALGARLGKPSRWLGRQGAALPWQTIDGSATRDWQEVVACLLLADRSGAATRADIDAFLTLVAQLAPRLPATFTLPDAAAEASRAEALDRICADLDVQIGLTILKADLGQIAGTRLRGVAEAAGFNLNAAGHFDYVQEETGAVLYSLQNYRQEPFTAENLRAQATPGVVFLLDVPRVADPVKAFDQMRLAAKRMTRTLEGVLVDDNRRPLTDAALAEIRSQVQATADALRETNIDPGGARALRLFG